MPESGASDALADLPENGDLIDGRYRVGRMLGVGGMGIVRAATHATLGHELALKFMLPDAAKSADAAERFVREARASARLTSEHVARVLDVGTLPGGLPYIVMERLRGEDLATLLEAKQRIPAAEAVGYVLQAIHAIAEAHLIGIVHRDIKPRNLFLTRRANGRTALKVLDFGIAKAGAALGEGTLTHSHHTLGSPHYMSPEQLEDSAGVDARTDIWSLGVVLYQLTSGTLPFDGETFSELSTAIQRKAAVPLGMRAPELPAELVALIERCLAKDPAQRPASVVELGRQLAAFADRDARAVFAETEQLLAARSRELDATLEIVPDPATLSHRARGTDDTHAAVESHATPGAGSSSGRTRRVWLVLGGAAGVIGLTVAVLLSSWSREAAPAAGAASGFEPPVSARPPGAPFQGTVSESSAHVSGALAPPPAPSASAPLRGPPGAKLPRRRFPPAAATATERTPPTSDPYLDRK